MSGRREDVTCLFTFRWGIFSRNINALCKAFIVWTLCHWRSASAAVVVENNRRAESQWAALFRLWFYDQRTVLVRNHPPNIVVRIGRFAKNGRQQKSLKMQMSDLNQVKWNLCCFSCIPAENASEEGRATVFWWKYYSRCLIGPFDGHFGPMEWPMKRGTWVPCGTCKWATFRSKNYPALVLFLFFCGAAVRACVLHPATKFTVPVKSPKKFCK